jgi:hypothetical protein
VYASAQDFIPSCARRKTFACWPAFQPLSQKSKIRLFRDGEFVGCRSRSTIEALLVRDLVRVEFNRKGFVVAAHEIHTPACPAPPTPTEQNNAHIPLPTKYSFEDDELTGRPWDLRRLNGSRHGIQYAPAAVRSIFFAVVSDCLR